MQRNSRFFVAFGIFSLLLVGFVSGCGNDFPSVYKTDGKPVYDMSLVITDGNYSLIPLSVRLSDGRKARIVLEALNAFEKTRSDVDVVSWQLLWHTDSYHYEVEGIWVHHRPRNTQTCREKEGGK